MPRIPRKRVRVQWRDPRAIKSHWGPFSFDTTTGLSRHAYWNWWQPILAIEKDTALRAMFEVIDDVAEAPVPPVNVIPTDGAPWLVPVDTIRMRTNNRYDPTNNQMSAEARKAHAMIGQEPVRPQPEPPPKDAEHLAALEHAAAVEKKTAPRPAAEQPFEIAKAFDDEKPAAPTVHVPQIQPAKPYATRSGGKFAKKTP